MPHAAAQLETPFSKHSLQSVVYLLRMLHHSADATPASLEVVAEHAAGIIRLAHALDVTGPLLPAAEAFLGGRMQRSAASALQWLPVAEECGLRSAQAHGIRQAYQGRWGHAWGG